MLTLKNVKYINSVFKSSRVGQMNGYIKNLFLKAPRLDTVIFYFMGSQTALTKTVFQDAFH